MRFFKATIAYDGSAYSGWQTQADRPTVQQTLEAAVERITAEPTRIAASGRTDAGVLSFGVTGKLRFSDMVMYDRQTETWWQQATGVGIVGDLTGAKLEFVPSQLISLDQFAAAYPDGQVLSRETGFSRDYGRNPYVGYDAIDQQPGGAQ